MKALIFCLFVSQLLWAQGASFPFAAGIQLEARSNLLPYEERLNLLPFVGLLLPALGQVKIGYIEQTTSHIDENTPVPLKASRLMLQTSVSLGFTPNSPYFLVSYTKNKWLRDDEAGDIIWNEYGFGLGGLWLVHPMMGLVLEGEYRLVDDHKAPGSKSDALVKGNSLQLNAGFFVYFL